MSPGPDGSLYFINEHYNASATTSTRVYQLTPPAKTNAVDCAIPLPSEDGSQKFCFNKDGRHLSTRNARTGEPLLSFGYGSDGLLTSVVDLVDRVDQEDQQSTTTIARTSTLVTITGPFGQTTKIALDPTTKYATRIEDATHQSTIVTHGASGLLLSLTDRNGKLHSFAYDSLGRLKQDSNTAGFQSLQRTATLNGEPIVASSVPIYDPVPAATPIAANGYSVSDTSAMGAARSFAVTVDSNGDEIRTVGMPDGTQNRSTTTRSGSTTTTFGDGSVVTTTSAVDPVSLLPYVNSQLTTYPSGTPSTQITRNKTLSASGTVSLERESLNGAAEMTRSFDSSTKTYTLTSPGGRTSTTVVDAHDRPRIVTPATGITPITYHYDHGRLDSVSQGTRQRRLFYYAPGTSTPGQLERITVTDGDGAISTRIVPDNAGRPLSSTTCKMNAAETACVGAAAETELGWDSEGNLTSVTPPWTSPPGERIHSQTYTGTNLLATYAPPAVADVPDPKTSFFYNRDGALEYVQQPGNRYIDYQVDPPTGRLLNDGNAQFAYYTSGSMKGRLSTAQTQTVSQSFTYDGPLPKVETTAWLTSNSSAGITRVFNADLRLQSEAISVTPTTGSTTATTATYGYDVDGLLTCAVLSGSKCETNLGNKLVLAYSATTGALTSTTFGATAAFAVSDAYTPNAYGELASYSAKIGTSSPFFSLTYDNSTGIERDGFGRVKRVTDHVAGTVRDYSYDEQGRLAWVGNGSSALRHYTYDSNGNRLSTSPTSTTAIATYDAQDRLTSYEGTAYKYWPNGELRSKTTADGAMTEYSYSPLGYLTGGTLPNGTTFNFSYDGAGRRIQKVIGSVTTRYIYRDGLRPVAVLDGNGSLISRFVYGSRKTVPDLMVLANGSTFRIISDQLGSPRVIVSVGGPSVIVQRIDYDEFGNRSVPTDSGAFAAVAQPFGFAGGLYDADTGLVHFGARDYDPVVGRWISKDPILFNGGQANLYVYVNNDPVNASDPSGKGPVDIARCVANGGSLSDCVDNEHHSLCENWGIACDSDDQTPGAVAPPTMTPNCKAVAADCRDQCVEEMLRPRGCFDNGPDFQRCFQSCKRDAGC
ncbi:MAG TPA: RHS repeat-associated core domain-containing protein [Polyangiaceae bacterium]|nr:RHS repeat-associated core domain-containing protein [Polyangiaceae bacterium]